MKLILTQPVSGLGSAGDVVEVKDGYARNYLVPRGLATGWTKGGQRQLDLRRVPGGVEDGGPAAAGWRGEGRLVRRAVEVHRVILVVEVKDGAPCAPASDL